MSDQRRAVLILAAALTAPSLTSGGWLQLGALFAVPLCGLMALAPWSSDER